MNGHLTKDDIEYYLLNREYSELYGQEKIFVDEHVSSEQEFNEMKAMLHGVGDIFTEEELTPDPSIKANLMKEFEKKRPASGYWLNGMLVAYFPKKEKFTKRPGVQLIGMAASVALMIGLFTQINTGDDFSSQQEVAQEETIEEPTVAPVQEHSNNNFNIVEEKELKEKEVDIEVINTLDQEIALDEDPVIEIVVPEEAPMAVSDEVILDNSLNKDVIVEAEEEAEADMVDFLADDMGNNTSVDDGTSNNTNLVISGNTQPTVAMELTDITVTDSKTLDEVSKKEFANSAARTASLGTPGKGTGDLPVNSRSLDEDAELIDLLYTAM